MMDFLEKLNTLSNKIRQQLTIIDTEEATKNAFVMPFIHNILGYDVFDPREVKPEFICDVGTKKGEKVDYAIMKEGEVQVLIECKKIGDNLSINHASQLFRYFHATNARISILTNGQIYKFFTDLDAPNKMDEKPFLEIDLLDLDENYLPELRKLTKSAFDIESIVNTAGELKYVSQIKKIIAAQFTAPEEEFVRLFASRVYDGMLTQKVKELFTLLTKKAATQFLNDQINERLKSAINTNAQIAADSDRETHQEVHEPEEHVESDIVTMAEELEGYYMVKAIIRNVLGVSRITYRDTKSYFGILADDNNRKPLCRLHFNRNQKYIGLFDAEKNETRIPLNSIDEIYLHTDALRSTAAQYANS